MQDFMPADRCAHATLTLRLRLFLLLNGILSAFLHHRTTKHWFDQLTRITVLMRLRHEDDTHVLDMLQGVKTLGSLGTFRADPILNVPKPSSFTRLES